MADERFDNEDLEENLPPEETLGDRLKDEAGEYAKDRGRQYLQDSARRGIDNIRSRFGRGATEGAKRAGLEAAKQTGVTAGKQAVGATAKKGAQQVGGKLAQQAVVQGARSGLVAALPYILIAILVIGLVVMLVLVAWVWWDDRDKGNTGNSFNKPLELAGKSAHRAQIQLLWCLNTRNSEELEEPPVKDAQGDENANKDAVTVKDAEVKDNKKESQNPQLTKECVIANAKMVDEALKFAKKQVAYFEQIKPKNLDALKKAYEELEKSGQAIKDAGPNLQKARGGLEGYEETNGFAAAYKILEAELEKVQISCDDLDLSLGAPNNYGLVELNPDAHPAVRRSSPNRYVNPNFACWLVRLVIRIKALDPRLEGVSIGQTTGPSGYPVGSPSVSHDNGFTADLHIPCVHPIPPAVFDATPCTYDGQLAERVAEVINSMQPSLAQFIVSASQSNVKPRATSSFTHDSSGVHDHHWHVSTYDF